MTNSKFNEINWVLNMEENGANARKKGLSRDSCPFVIEENCQAWLAGWDRVDNEYCEELLKKLNCGGVKDESR